MSAIEIGKTVRQKVPVIQGPVVDTQYNKTLKCLEHLVEYQDAEGETHTRWFLESELEAVDQEGA